MKPHIDWKAVSDDETLCFCSQVKKGEVVTAILGGASTIAKLQKATGAGIGNRCAELNPKGRCCHPDLAALIGIYAPDNNKSGNAVCKCSCNNHGD